MGILDQPRGMDNPLFHMGMGLLSRSGTKGQLGQGLAAGLGSYQAALSAKEKRELQELQKQKIQAELDAAEQERKRNLKMTQKVQGLLLDKEAPFEQDLFPGEEAITGLTTVTPGMISQETDQGKKLALTMLAEDPTNTQAVSLLNAYKTSDGLTARQRNALAGNLVPGTDAWNKYILDQTDESGGFGRSLIGKSQAILSRLQSKKDRGEALTRQEEIDWNIAQHNLTTPQTQVRTDPTTGEAYTATITPQLPSIFGGKGDIPSPAAVAPPSGSVTTPAPAVDIQRPTGPGKAAKKEAEATINQMDILLTNLDDLEASVVADPSVTGVRGKFSRLAEGLLNQVPGVNLPVEARAYLSKVEATRTLAKNLVDVGKLSDQDYERVERLLSGTGMLDSPQGTIAAYNEIRKLLTAKKGQAEGILQKPKVRKYDPKTGTFSQ